MNTNTLIFLDIEINFGRFYFFFILLKWRHKIDLSIFNVYLHFNKLMQKEKRLDTE